MLPRQPQPTSAPKLDCSPGGKETALCKKYIWGTCNKYAQCRYRHELDTELMKDILQFCHDYQNRNGCTRENCKYLHATKEEQNIFLATGQIPPVLAERHAAMAAAASNMQNNAETIPQIAMFISESYISQPPPGQWPPLPATAPPPPPPPGSPPRHGPAVQPVQQAQQLPPPPAPASSAAQHAATTYAAMPPPQMATLNQPPPIVLPNFDASRPPPPIPSLMQPNNNGQLKRKVDSNGNAATTKIRKPDGSELSESHCENCVQREIRIDGYKHVMEALHNEEETQILLYKKKLQEYEMGKDILKKIVGPEMYIVIHNLIEGDQAPQLDNLGASASFMSGDQAPQLDNLGASASFMSSSSSVSKQAQAFLQLFQMCLGGGSRNVLEPPIPSTSHMDETLQSLISLTRRHNTNYIHPGPDLIKYVVDTLRNSSAAELPPSVEERPNEPSDMSRMNRTNGFMSNGQKAQASATSESARCGGVGPGYGAMSAPGAEYAARLPPAMPGYSVPGPSGYGAPAPAPPPAAYPVFHPAIPPPSNGPYYAQGPVTPGGSHMPYNGAERAAGLGPSHGMPPPATSSALRPNQANAPNYNYMGRPQPPYYPPYQ